MELAKRLAALAVLLTLCLTPPVSAAAEGGDALQRRALSELAAFAAWLRANDARGYVGEVGWPHDREDAAQWNDLAERWYRRADRVGLWVTAWATGEWWGTGYRLAPYVDRKPVRGVDSRARQARVIERHGTAGGRLRGVSVAGGEFAAPSIEPRSSFSNRNPGDYGVAYHYDSRATFEYLASVGVRLVRIPFRWERLQPQLGAPLDPAELERLRGVVRRARAAGLRVVLDMHNYGAYYVSNGSEGVRSPIGSEAVPIEAFAEVWGRVALNFGSEPGIAGYGLMNEPVGLPGRPAHTWEVASQSAVERIRYHGDDTTVLVGGYPWSGIRTWAEQHPKAWIEDPTGRVRYEAHHYWDRDASGSYVRSYDEEVADASVAAVLLPGALLLALIGAWRQMPRKRRRLRPQSE